MPIQDLLTRHGLRPDKKLGQHFLSDQQLLERELAYAELRPGDIVLEIGPGIGNLTALLARQAGRVVAIERDPQFAACLGILQQQHSQLEVLWGDALEVDFPPFDKAVANLPYQVALPLIFKLLERRFERAVLMVQRDLARRLVARVGESGYGRLSVAVGRRAEVELLEEVPRQAFYPPPEVESALVRIARTRPKFSVPDEEFFRVVLEAFFRNRQETLAQAAQAIRCRELPQPLLARTMSRLGEKLRRKPVCRVTPAEFGELAWALWKGRSG
ncbi:MAG: ribosomal RNA small subunit methyltransferase A [Candidatus Latescibacteria bacterium]|nr:ribosomal RNA small subunit methyltransferase A [Candidatus Latescibacterota bacterium]